MVYSFSSNSFIALPGIPICETPGSYILMLFDTLIFYQLNGLALQWLWLDCVVIFFAVYAPWILAGVLFLFLLKNFKRHFQWVAGAFLSAVLGGLLVLLVNFIFYRARPFAAGDVNLLLQHLSNSSFPSFHTTVLFALSFFIFLKKKKSGCVFLSVSFLAALSRVIAGVHWLSDILAGIFLGILTGWLSYKIFSHRAV